MVAPCYSKVLTFYLTIFTSIGLKSSQFANFGLRNKNSALAIFDLNQANNAGVANYYSQESPDHVNSLIDESMIFNRLNRGGTAKLDSHLNNSRKSLNSGNLSGFVNGNSSSTNSASTSSSSSVASFSSGYESSMQRKPAQESNDLDHLFHPILAPSIYKTSSDLLYMTVKWAKSLPLFLNLNYKDQVSFQAICTKFFTS